MIPSNLVAGLAAEHISDINPNKIGYCPLCKAHAPLAQKVCSAPDCISNQTEIVMTNESPFAAGKTFKVYTGAKIVFTTIEPGDFWSGTNPEDMLIYGGTFLRVSREWLAQNRSYWRPTS